MTPEFSVDTTAVAPVLALVGLGVSLSFLDFLVLPREVYCDIIQETSLSSNNLKPEKMTLRRRKFNRSKSRLSRHVYISFMLLNCPLNLVTPISSKNNTILTSLSLFLRQLAGWFRVYVNLRVQEGVHGA